MVIWIVTGFWVLLGCTEMAHLITIWTNRTLETYILLCGGFVTAGLLAYIGFLCIFRHKIFPKKEKKDTKGWVGYPILFALLTIITIVFMQRSYTPLLQEATYDIVLGNVKQGEIMSVHPFLGTGDVSGMPFRMEILGLSSLYSCLITISKQTPYIILCKVVPTIVWICAMLIYKAFADKLFPASKDKQWLFLCFIAFFFLMTANSEGMAGQRLFYAGFSAETIRGVVLLPYAVYVSWQRKWLLALLSILAEACLVWTTYGIGYSSIIVGCMLVVHLWADRRCRHAA